MITINGLKFAASEKQFINGLFNGETFEGTYKKIKNGIVFRDLSGKPFAVIGRYIDTKTSGLFAANVMRDGVSVFYAKSYNETTLKKLGVEKVTDLDLESILTEQGV